MPTKKADFTGFYFVQGDGKLSQNYADLINSIDICETEIDQDMVYPINLHISNKTASAEIGEVSTVKLHKFSTVNIYNFCKLALGWHFIEYLYYKIFGKPAPWRKRVF